MVRSNSASGVGRSVLSESLESRRLFTAVALDPAFHAGEEAGQKEIHLGGRSEGADAAAVLNSGRLLVAGHTTLSGKVRDAVLLLNKDGTLANSFNGAGTLIFDQATTDKIGAFFKVVATPDGGGLVVGKLGMAKLLATGKLDPNFGFNSDAKTGIDSYGGGYVFKDLILAPNSNGTDGTEIRVLFENTSGPARTYIETYDLNGVPTSDHSFTKVGDNTVFLDAQHGAASTANKGVYSEYGFDSGFTRRAGFGNNGVADLTTAYHKWVNANGPFANVTKDPQGYPVLTVVQQQAGPDGSVVLEGVVSGTTGKAPSAVGGKTVVFITIDSTGHKIVVSSGPNTGGATFYDGVYKSSSNVNGTFYVASGGPLDVAVSYGTRALTASAADTDGATYLVGTYTNDSYNGGFAIDRVLPLKTTPTTGTISGVLFNDDNVDQVRQSYETLNVGKTVYIDANHNNKFDSNEIHTVTDADGRYKFTGLAAGTYSIHRVLPSRDYRITSADAEYGSSVTLAAGQNLTVDIGSTVKALLYGTVSYASADGAATAPAGGQRVFYDLNKDGIFENNEPNSVSDVNGNYHLVSNAGTYRVTIIPPAGYKTYDTNPFDTFLDSGSIHSDDFRFVLKA